LGGEVKTVYSNALLNLATGRRLVGLSPLAFGEGGVKERVKNILNFKKRSRVIIVAAVALVAVLTVGFAVNRGASNSLSLPKSSEVSFIMVEQVNDGEMIGERYFDWDSDIAVVLSHLDGAAKTSTQSVDDFPVKCDNNNSLLIQMTLADGITMRRLSLYSKDGEYFIEEPYMGIYSTTREVSIALYKIYNGTTVSVLSLANLSKLRTPYVGDNSAVGRIIDALPPLGDRHTQKFFSIGDDYGTGRAPNTLTVYYEQNGEINDDYVLTALNPILLFALIDNLEEVSIAIRHSPSGDELDKSAYGTRMTYTRTDNLAGGLTIEDFHNDWNASVERLLAWENGSYVEQRPGITIYEYNISNVGSSPFQDGNSTKGFVPLPARVSDGVIELNDVVTVAATIPSGTVRLELLYAETGSGVGISFGEGQGHALDRNEALISDFAATEWFPNGFSGQIWAVATDADGDEHYSERLNAVYTPKPTEDEHEQDSDN
jgi:hypothetical protein